MKNKNKSLLNTDTIQMFTNFDQANVEVHKRVYDYLLVSIAKSKNPFLAKAALVLGNELKSKAIAMLNEEKK